MGDSVRRLSKGSKKQAMVITPVNRKTSMRKKKIKTKQELFEEASERRIEMIRQTPMYDRFGREYKDGTPLGSGDKQWRMQYGIGAKYSPKTPLLGIGIARDSFLPSECRVNEKAAMRNTPRSTKLTKEQKEFAKENGYDSNEEFMTQFRLVCKRVAPIETLGMTKELNLQLRPLIYKRAGYALQDKRASNAHFGYSTREQMLKSQLWQGDIQASASDVFYFPSYKLLDKRQPSFLYGTKGPDYWKAKHEAEEQKWHEDGAPREPHWSEHTEMPKTIGTVNFDARVPTAPSFSFGASKRPLIGGGGSMNPPIYNVHIENDPNFLPRYKTFGERYRSMGYGEKERTKSRVPKSTEWGPVYVPKTGKTLNPARFGKLLAPKNSLPYSHYKLYG